jgi:hypothetical protein
MSAKVGFVSGTWGRKPADSGSYTWWLPPSVFTANLKNAGLELLSETDYFDWSTALDGLGANHDDWQTAGKALYWWWVANGRAPLSLVAHSHGAQVVAYALQYGSRISRAYPMVLSHLVTAGSPVRADMDTVWAAVQDQVRDWTHLYTDETGGPTQGFQFLGSLPLDDGFGFRRTMPRADHNVEIVPATSHHGLMWPKLWNDNDLWRFLKP